MSRIYLLWWWIRDRIDDLIYGKAECPKAVTDAIDRARASRLRLLTDEEYLKIASEAPAAELLLSASVAAIEWMSMVRDAMVRGTIRGEGMPPLDTLIYFREKEMLEAAIVRTRAARVDFKIYDQSNYPELCNEDPLDVFTGAFPNRTPSYGLKYPGRMPRI